MEGPSKVVLAPESVADPVQNNKNVWIRFLMQPWRKESRLSRPLRRSRTESKLKSRATTRSIANKTWPWRIFRRRRRRLISSALSITISRWQTHSPELEQLALYPSRGPRARLGACKASIVLSKALECCRRMASLIDLWSSASTTWSSPGKSGSRKTGSSGSSMNERLTHLSTWMEWRSTRMTKRL